MNIIDAILNTLFEFATILAVLAVIGALVWYFVQKTQTGARFKAATPWMGWTTEEEVEDAYTNFTIHRSNYIKVPNSR